VHGEREILVLELRGWIEDLNTIQDAITERIEDKGLIEVSYRCTWCSSTGPSLTLLGQARSCDEPGPASALPALELNCRQAGWGCAFPIPSH